MELLYLLIIPGSFVLACFLPLLIGPIILYGRPVAGACPEYQSLDLDDVRPDQRQHILHNAPAFASLGFTAAAHAVDTNAPSNCVAVVSVWINRASGDTAAITSIQGYGNGRLLIVNEYAEFEIEYADGTVINTSNVAVPPLWPNRPGNHGLRCPGLADVHLLYKIHRDRVANHAPVGSFPILPNEGHELSVLCVEHAQSEYRRVASLGYFRLDRTGKTYRHTVKGAILFAWRCAWPVMQVRKLLLVCRASRTLRVIGHTVAAAQLRKLSWREFIPLALLPKEVEDRSRGFTPILDQTLDAPTRTPPPQVKRIAP